MADKTDWRYYCGHPDNIEEDRLYSATLVKRKYQQWNDIWEHDHCSFCWAKFAEESHIPDALHEGYATEDEGDWICEDCFNDFKDLFQWKVRVAEGTGVPGRRSVISVKNPDGSVMVRKDKP